MKSRISAFSSAPLRRQGPSLGRQCSAALYFPAFRAKDLGAIILNYSVLEGFKGESTNCYRSVGMPLCEPSRGLAAEYGMAIRLLTSMG